MSSLSSKRCFFPNCFVSLLSVELTLQTYFLPLTALTPIPHMWSPMVLMMLLNHFGFICNIRLFNHVANIDVTIYVAIKHGLFLLRNTDSATTATGCLGVLTTDSYTPGQQNFIIERISLCCPFFFPTGI